MQECECAVCVGLNASRSCWAPQYHACNRISLRPRHWYIVRYLSTVPHSATWQFAVFELPYLIPSLFYGRNWKGWLRGEIIWSSPICWVTTALTLLLFFLRCCAAALLLLTWLTGEILPAVPDVAFDSYNEKFVEPDKSEGFTEVVKWDFVLAINTMTRNERDVFEWRLQPWKIRF